VARGVNRRDTLKGAGLRKVENSSNQMFITRDSSVLSKLISDKMEPDSSMVDNLNEQNTVLDREDCVM
jgi:hypothetical protein